MRDAVVYPLEETRTLADGRLVPVFALVDSPANRRFLLTNPESYSLTYHGLVTAVEKRLANGWQAFASYTLSRTYGLQPSSGGAAGDPQFSSVLAGAFGRDQNSLTNARGRLPNDRPHVLRGSASLRVPRTGFVVAASAQHFSGKPWAASAQISLPQGDQRVLLESRGSRRLSAQTLLDVRLSRTLPLRGPTRVELLLDVLNALNEAAEEALATDNLYSSNFGQPTVFVDPRRVMLSVRLSIGRYNFCPHRPRARGCGLGQGKGRATTGKPIVSRRYRSRTAGFQSSTKWRSRGGP